MDDLYRVCCKHKETGIETVGLLSRPRQEALEIAAQLALGFPQNDYRLVPAESISPDTATPYGMAVDLGRAGGE